MGQQQGDLSQVPSIHILVVSPGPAQASVTQDLSLRKNARIHGVARKKLRGAPELRGRGHVQEKQGIMKTNEQQRADI